MARSIGLIAMSAKPYHAAHDTLIRDAASENDEVHVYVSTSDRKRPGEFAISGSDMYTIWRLYIEPSLPDNVVVKYGGAPVAHVYKEIGLANDNKSDNTYTIYTGAKDVEQNFPEKSLVRYAGGLFANGQVKIKLSREELAGVTGTVMRKYLK